MATRNKKTIPPQEEMLEILKRIDPQVSNYLKNRCRFTTPRKCSCNDLQRVKMSNYSNKTVIVISFAKYQLFFSEIYRV